MQTQTSKTKSQHTKTATNPVKIYTIRGARMYVKRAQVTPAQLRKILTDKVAKGYVFATIRVDVALIDGKAVNTTHIVFDDHHWLNIPAGLPDFESTVRAYRMPTREVRE